MKTNGQLLRAILPLSFFAITACEDANGPDSLAKLNTTAALADYAALDAIRQSAGWHGFQMAAPKMAARMMLAHGDVATKNIPLISDAHRGKTFVYDAVKHDWVIDPSRTDAPANGVRFITYQPKGAEPDPTKPIGHADLIDLGNTSAGIALRLIVTEGSMTILDYQTTVEGGETGGHVTVAGFIQNATDKLDFDIDVTGQSSGGVERGDISFEIGIASREFHVTGDVEGEKTNGIESGAVDLTVRHGTSSFNVDVENERGALDGRISLNGSPFAMLSGTSQQPVFKTAGGVAIGGAEALLLGRVFDVTEDVFDLFEDLIDPIDDLVMWAAIL